MPQPQTFIRLRSLRRDGMTTMAATTPWPCPYCGAILGAHTSGLFLFLIKMLLPRRLSFSMGGWFISSLNTFTLPFNLVFQPLEIPSSTLFWFSVSDNQQSAPWLRMNSSVWTVVPHWQDPHGLLHLLPQPRQSWLQAHCYPDASGNCWWAYLSLGQGASLLSGHHAPCSALQRHQHLDTRQWTKPAWAPPTRCHSSYLQSLTKLCPNLIFDLTFAYRVTDSGK